MKGFKERKEIVKTGVELRVLRKEDVEFILNMENSDVMARNRLRQRIMDMPDDWHEDGNDMIGKYEFNAMLSA